MSCRHLRMMYLDLASCCPPRIPPLGNCASKKLVAQELEAAQLAIKTLENNCVVLKAQRDKAMDKAVRAGRILMRRPGVIVPNNIVADVKAAPDAASRPSSSVAPTKDAVCKDTSA
jgi:hypothetical protein